MVQSCSSGDWLIVSNGSSLTSPTWKAVALGGPLGANGDLTMKVGWDINGIYISELHSGGTLPNDYDLYGIPAADVAWTGGGSPSIANKQLFTVQGHDMMCAIDQNAAKALTDKAYCASVSSPSATTNASFSWQIDEFSWPSGGVTGACTNGAGSTRCASLATRQSIASNFKANASVNPPQPSTTVTINGSENSRIFGLWEFGTHLYGVRGTGPCTGALGSCGTQGVDANNLFFFFDINITTPASLTLQQSLKVSSPTVAYMFPELVIDSSGNVVITANAIGSSTFASIDSWYRLTTDAVSTLRGPTVVTAGTLPYTCSTNNPAAWGTYYSGAQDATDGSKIWMVHQYGGNSSSCVQKTRLIELQAAAPSTSAATPSGNFSNMQVWGAIN